MFLALLDVCHSLAIPEDRHSTAGLAMSPVSGLVPPSHPQSLQPIVHWQPFLTRSFQTLFLTFSCQYKTHRAWRSFLYLFILQIKKIKKGNDYVPKVT
jgi:hypothetical protein